MIDKEVQPEEVQKWVELLQSSVATEQLKGAMELASLGVSTRGGSLTGRLLTLAQGCRLICRL